MRNRNIMVPATMQVASASVMLAADWAQADLLSGLQAPMAARAAHAPRRTTNACMCCDDRSQNKYKVVAADGAELTVFCSKKCALSVAADLCGEVTVRASLQCCHPTCHAMHQSGFTRRLEDGTVARFCGKKACADNFAEVHGVKMTRVKGLSSVCNCQGCNDNVSKGAYCVQYTDGSKARFCGRECAEQFAETLPGGKETVISHNRRCSAADCQLRPYHYVGANDGSGDTFCSIACAGDRLDTLAWQEHLDNNNGTMTRLLSLLLSSDNVPPRLEEELLTARVESCVLTIKDAIALFSRAGHPFGIMVQKAEGHRGRTEALQALASYPHLQERVEAHRASCDEAGFHWGGVVQTYTILDTEHPLEAFDFEELVQDALLVPHPEGNKNERREPRDFVSSVDGVLYFDRAGAGGTKHPQAGYTNFVTLSFVGPTEMHELLQTLMAGTDFPVTVDITGLSGDEHFAQQIKKAPSKNLLKAQWMLIERSSIRRLGQVTHELETRSAGGDEGGEDGAGAEGPLAGVTMALPPDALGGVPEMQERALSAASATDADDCLTLPTFCQMCQQTALSADEQHGQMCAACVAYDGLTHANGGASASGGGAGAGASSAAAPDTAAPDDGSSATPAVTPASGKGASSGTGTDGDTGVLANLTNQPKTLCWLAAPGEHHNPAKSKRTRAPYVHARKKPRLVKNQGLVTNYFQVK